MKRFLMLVGVAVVAAAMYVAASPASQQAKGPTARQFKALKNQVASLSKTVKGLKAVVGLQLTVLEACDQHAVAIAQYGSQTTDTAAGEGYNYHLPTNTPQDVLTTALDVGPGNDPQASVFAYGDTTCATELNGSALRHAAAKVGVRLPRASHAASFTVHQP